MPLYKFDDIIINSTEKRAGQPGDEASFITLNNITPHKLTISNWGVQEPFFDEKLIVRKGDVLFIKREPQNHQVAISPIDGLFTGFGMVLRPKTNVILPDFLPYFISSDTFINKVSSISVGTKFKTINWSELKELIFDIPTIEQQKLLLNPIKTIECIDLKYSSIIDDLNKARISFYNEKILNSHESNSYTLGELMFLRRDTIRVENSNSINYITYDEMTRSAAPHTINRSSFYAYKLDTNQILAHKTSFCKGSMILVPEQYKGVITSNQTQIFSINQKVVIPEFLLYMLTRPTFISTLENMDLSTDNWNYTFSKHRITVPPINIQNKYLDFCQSIEKSLNSANQCKTQAYESLQSLLCEHIHEA